MSATTTPTTTPADGSPRPTGPVARLVRWLETGGGAAETFAADCFLDLSLPQWRVQSDSVAAIAAIRQERHPSPGRVRVERIDPTDTGFVLAFEERWVADGRDWYCRELVRADLVDDRIVDLAVYCTGDWDEETQARHADEVTLLRP